MSVLVNDKGGTEHRVNLVKRGTGTYQHNMLKSVLVKKAENYHLQCDRYVTNDLPPISQAEKVLITILTRGDHGTPYPRLYDHTNYGEQSLSLRSQFKISGFDKGGGHVIYSTAGLVHEICRFFKDFNFELNMQGANYSNFEDEDDEGAINEENWVAQHYEYNNLHSPGNEIDRNTVEDYITAGIDSVGRLQLNISSQFWCNYYIKFDDVFAKIIGFPQFLYAADIGGNIQVSNRTNDAGEYNMVALYSPPPNPLFSLDTTVEEGRNVKSTKSLFNFDDRLSFDLEVSLPLSMSIDILNGSENHTYVLSRFQITDYKHTTTRTKSKNGYLLSEGIFQDNLVGRIDLVRDEPNSHVSQLINGKIQAMNVRVILRYRKYEVVNDVLQFTIESRPIEMDAFGFYDILTQFNKRLT